MRVFLAGATGAIGRPLVGQLTALPDRFEPRKKGLYEPTNQLRTVGTRNLLAAARRGGAGRFICQSIAFAYEPSGGGGKDERDPAFSEGPEPFGSAIAAVEEMEKAVLDAEGIEGLVLRYGWFYGPGTYFDEDGSTASDVRRRRYPIVGDGGGLFSFVQVDDAAAATVAALERGRPGIYNVVDDEPASMGEWLPQYAEALGAKPPRRVPRWLARLLAGKMVAEMSTELRGASNEKARRELGWRPVWGSWQEGFRRAPR